MILYFIITILIAIFAVKDWKHTVLAWLPISMLFNPAVCLRYESPALSLVLVINIFLLCIYLLRRTPKSQFPFMFRKSFMIYVISYTFSLLFSIAPFFPVFTESIRFFINSFVIVFLFHKALTSFADIRYYIIFSIIVFIPIILLAFFECVFHDNPWLDYVYLSAPNPDLLEGKFYYYPPFLTSTGDLATRFGLVRCNSFFRIHIEFGCACVLYLYLFLFFNDDKLGNKSRIGKWNILISFCCVLGIFLCTSKTPFVGLFFFLLSVYPMRKILSVKSFLSFISIVTIGMVILAYNDSFFDTFLSLFDKEKMEEGGGSTVEMRETQFGVAFDFFMNNPLFGNGLRSLPLLREDNSEIYGAESSWLLIPIQQGILGIFAYLLLYKEMYAHLSKSIGKRASLFYLIGLMGLETVTGPMSFYIFAPTLIAIERYFQLIKKCPNSIS